MEAEDTSEVTLLLSETERDELLLVLEQALKEGRVQRRRTEAFQAKEIVQAHVSTLERLVDKVHRLR